MNTGFFIAKSEVTTATTRDEAQDMADSFYISSSYTPTTSGLYTEDQIAASKAILNSGSYSSTQQEDYDDLISFANQGLTYNWQKPASRTIDGSDKNDVEWAAKWDGHYIHAMAIAYRLTDNVNYADKAIEGIDLWSNDTTGINQMLPVYNAPTETAGRVAAEQVSGRYFPNFIEAAFLLRSKSPWVNHPTIDTTFTTWLNDFVYPECAHGIQGGDYDAGDMPYGNNHAFGGIMLGFQCNFYLGLGETDYQNCLSALNWHHMEKNTNWDTTLPAPHDKWTTGFGTAYEGSQLRNTDGSVTGYTSRTVTNTLPIEDYRGTSAHTYVGGTILTIVAIYKLIWNNRGENLYPIDHGGINFSDILQEYYDMGVGNHTWAFSGSNLSTTEQQISELYLMCGDFLNRSDWMAWADSGRAASNWTVDDKFTSHTTRWCMVGTLFQ